MATEPRDVADLGGNRNSETTELTNAMASLPGFPALTQDGETVRIVKVEYEGQKLKVLTDSDGKRYVDTGPDGVLIDYFTEDDLAPAEEVPEVPVAETPEAIQEAISETIGEGNADELDDNEGLAQSA